MDDEEPSRLVEEEKDELEDERTGIGEGREACPFVVDEDEIRLRREGVEEEEGKFVGRPGRASIPSMSDNGDVDFVLPFRDDPWGAAILFPGFSSSEAPPDATANFRFLSSPPAMDCCAPPPPNDPFSDNRLAKDPFVGFLGIEKEEGEARGGGSM